MLLFLERTFTMGTSAGNYRLDTFTCVRIWQLQRWQAYIGETIKFLTMNTVEVGVLIMMMASATLITAQGIIGGTLHINHFV